MQVSAIKKISLSLNIGNSFQFFWYFGLPTLKSLIEEHARLDFSDFISTLFVIFHVINEKFHPARLSIYLVKKQAEGFFFSNPARLFRSAHLLGTSE